MFHYNQTDLQKLFYVLKQQKYSYFSSDMYKIIHFYALFWDVYHSGNTFCVMSRWLYVFCLWSSTNDSNMIIVSLSKELDCIFCCVFVDDFTYVTQGHG
jgi:hypothetical protein